MSCTIVEVVKTYIYVICNGLRVLENVAAIIEKLNCLFPYPFNQILQAFFNGVIIGAEELTDVCPTQLNRLSDYVKGKCPTLNLLSVINRVLDSTLIKGKEKREILKKIQCLKLDQIVLFLSIQGLHKIAELLAIPSRPLLHAQLSN